MSGTHETVAGTMAGIAGKLVEHPLDTIKTRLQEACSSHRTVSDCFHSILKNEGAASFFRGISAPVVASAGEHAFTFLTFSEAISLVERARCHFRGEDAGSAASGRAHSSSSGRAQVPLSTHAIAGGVSGFISATIITPVEYFKCRMQQCNSRKRMTFRDCTRNGGWRHVFDGHVATVARDVPGTAAWFLCYELALRQFRAWEGVEELNATQVAAAGAIAGVMYWSAFFPGRRRQDSDAARQRFLSARVLPRAADHCKSRGSAGLVPRLVLYNDKRRTRERRHLLDVRNSNDLLPGGPNCQGSNTKAASSSSGRLLMGVERTMVSSKTED